MRQKPLLGSILVLTVLLVIPSIPAIQNRIVKDEIKQDCRENNFKDILQLKLPIKFPMLLITVLGLYQFRWTRSNILFELATTPTPLPPGYEVVKPLIFLRAVTLFISATIRFDYWTMLSESLGWGWLE